MVCAFLVDHIVITPVKDEGEILQRVIDSMAGQSILPSAWIFVDDCSTDCTVEIIDRAKTRHEWIQLVNLNEETERQRGAKISKMFNLGLEQYQKDWDYCSKIDADIVLPEDYFERIFDKFDLDPNLGIASGNCFLTKNNGGVKIEKVESDHTRGALKTYRKDCFLNIGGLREIDGWDGIDNYLAQYHGWRTKNFQEILAHHLRPTGVSEGSMKQHYNSGRKSHILGYTWPYLIGKSLTNLFTWPYILASICILFGFIGAKISGLRSVEEVELRRFIAKKQYRRIKGIFSVRKLFKKTDY